MTDNSAGICLKCGRPLFEAANGNKKIFCSFATRKDDKGNYYYLCYECHENKNKELFEKRSETD